MPDNPTDFFPWLKVESEKLWENVTINPSIFGFQIQSGTKWLAGLTDDEISNYEEELGFSFPKIYKLYLKNMNGTDKPGINVYGSSGYPFAYAPEFYSYPRDLDIVKDKIKWIYDEFEITEEFIRSENIPHIIPIIGHRFLVADNCEKNPVLSMMGKDSIRYASTLENYLVIDIFHSGAIVTNVEPVEVKFWLQQEEEWESLGLNNN